MSDRDKTQDHPENQNEEIQSRAEHLGQEAPQFRTRLYSISDAVIATDTAGTILQMNRVAEELTGWSEAEALGLSLAQVFRIINEETRAEIESPVERIVHDGMVIGLADRTLLIARDGTERPIAESGAPIRDEHGATVGAMLVFCDKSRELVAQKKLQESEQILETQFTHSPDVILIIDRHLKIIRINRVIAGPDTVEQLVGRDAIEILPADRDMVRRRIAECFISGEKQEFEHEIGDGTRVHARLVPLPSVGPTERIMIISTDITERRHTEEERRQFVERSFQAQKMESIGALAGGIAHDFNNLLAALMAGLSLMELDCADDDGVHEQLSEMKAVVQRGADLTKQLLGFARLGKYDAKPLDLNDVVKKISKMFGRTRKDISIHIECAFNLLPVLADRSQIEQVLLNLLVNAGRAMPEGGDVLLRTGNVELSEVAGLFDGAKPGRYAILCVEDTGIGIDVKARERIFEPFFTTKENGYVTGLGLASVYGIVKNHGGFVTVESEQGKGSTFKVFLPATEQAIVKDRVQRPAPATASQRIGETILVVDDEEPIVRSVSRLLAALGYEVLTAPNGMEAIEIVRNNREQIALVILDMIMPGMSGSQTFDALRAIVPSVKVLLSSGYSVDGQATEILERGCNGFIQKPFDLAALSAKLREIL